MVMVMVIVIVIIIAYPLVSIQPVAGRLCRRRPVPVPIAGRSPNQPPPTHHFFSSLFSHDFQLATQAGNRCLHLFPLSLSLFTHSSLTPVSRHPIQAARSAPPFPCPCLRRVPVGPPESRPESTPRKTQPIQSAPGSQAAAGNWQPATAICSRSQDAVLSNVLSSVLVSSTMKHITFALLPNSSIPIPIPKTATSPSLHPRPHNIISRNNITQKVHTVRTDKVKTATDRIRASRSDPTAPLSR